MEWASSLAAIVGMFLLRLGVPLVITLALGYALHRLDAKWHREETRQPDIRGEQQGPQEVGPRYC